MSRRSPSSLSLQPNFSEKSTIYRGERKLEMQGNKSTPIHTRCCYDGKRGGASARELHTFSFHEEYCDRYAHLFSQLPVRGSRSMSLCIFTHWKEGPAAAAARRLRCWCEQQQNQISLFPTTRSFSRWNLRVQSADYEGNDDYARRKREMRGNNEEEEMRERMGEEKKEKKRQQVKRFTC